MEIYYKRNYNESYMVAEGAVAWECFEKRMLGQNRICSLLPFHTMEVNGQTQFWYDITGKESLKDYMEQELSVERLEKVMAYIGFACEEAQKYLLSQNHIVLNPETIYVAHCSQPFAVYLCYYPWEGSGLREQLQGVVEYLLSIVDQKQETLAALCYEIYDRLVVGEAGLAELMDCIHQYTANPEQQSTANPGQQAAVELQQEDAKERQQRNAKEQQGEELYLQEFFQDPEEADKGENLFFKAAAAICERGKVILESIRSLKGTGGEKERREDVIFEAVSEPSEPTVLLYAGEENCVGRLVYDGSDQEESFLITRDAFRIGSGEENDACLHSRTVSHCHARITVCRQEYRIEDLNSTNGTYVNDVLLNYREPVLLHPMDHIRFADVPYLFL